MIENETVKKTKTEEEALLSTGANSPGCITKSQKVMKRVSIEREPSTLVFSISFLE